MVTSHYLKAGCNQANLEKRGKILDVLLHIFKKFKLILQRDRSFIAKKTTENVANFDDCGLFFDVVLHCSV